MDIVETCIPDSLSIISQSEEKINSSINSTEPELIVLNTVSEAKIENLDKTVKGKGINFLSACDDSFEVFLPIKKSSEQKLDIFSKKQSGKQKVKKSSSSRSCPYFSTKNIKNHFKSPSKSQEEKDLELALARSLLDVSGSGETSTKCSDESTSHLNRKEPETVYKLTKNENAFKLKNWTGKKDRKKKGNTLLSKRTSDDRGQIIAKKLAIVLLETKEITNHNSCENKIELCSNLLGRIADKNLTLWELSKIKCDELNSFYVGALSNFVEEVMPSNSEAVPDNVTEVVCNRASSSMIQPERVINDEDSFNFGTKLESLKLLSDNWSNLLGQEEFKDVNVLIGSVIFPGHKIVFKARCPDILKEIDVSSSPNVLDLSHYPIDCAKKFLEYIYSGRTDNISYLTNYEREFLADLANKYNLKYLSSLMQPSNKQDIYSQSTQSQNSNSHSKEEVTNEEKNDSGHLRKHDLQIDFLDPKESLLVLSDSSSDSEQIKSFLPQKPNCSFKSDYNTHEEAQPFAFFSKRCLSPDLFESYAKSENSSAANISGSSSQSKRKLSFDESSGELKKKSLQNDVFLRSQSNFADELIIIDSNSEDTKSPKPSHNHEISLRQVALSSDSSDFESNDNAFHYNFDINDDYSFVQLNKQDNNKKDEIIFNENDKIKQASFDESSNEMNLYPKTKKSSLEKYLHTSFPSFIDDINEVETVPKEPRMSSHLSLSSPSPSTSVEEAITPDIIIKDATPAANYSDMASPQLKAELARYGLKQNLGRRKAKALLRYIYEQIHPVDVPQASTPTSSKLFQQEK